MNLKRNIKTFVAFTLMTLTSISASAQDFLARQAPVDRKMKAVDTIALRNIIEREQAYSPAGQLYAEWSNKYAHRTNSVVPDSFRIDLRGFHMPTDSRVVTSNYGKRWGRMHKGIDVKVYIGDTIRSAFAGKVRIVNYEASGYGNYVVIRHNNGLETIYGHMSKNLVKENETVKAGDPIGLGGNTGRSTGSHLHFETRLCGIAINPALMFDFRNQDVTADFYMFRNNAKAASKSLAENNEESVGAESDAANNDVAEAREAAAPAKAKKAARETVRYHKVSKGETLSSIARKRGTTVEKLCKLNRIGRGMRLQPGQKLKYS